MHRLGYLPATASIVRSGAQRVWKEMSSSRLLVSLICELPRLENGSAYLAHNVLRKHANDTTAARVADALCCPQEIFSLWSRHKSTERCPSQLRRKWNRLRSIPAVAPQMKKRS